MLTENVIRSIVDPSEAVGTRGGHGGCWSHGGRMDRKLSRQEGGRGGRNSHSCVDHAVSSTRVYSGKYVSPF